MESVHRSVVKSVKGNYELFPTIFIKKKEKEKEEERMIFSDMKFPFKLGGI